jgi:CPA1 family monovalent cation:H+ antiporter
VPWSHLAIISWAGMRGVVTLAAAFTLPSETPQRSILVMAAMVVTVGTLLIQGTTLPWLARRLRVRGPDPREDALQEATILQAAVAAGLKALEECDEVEPGLVEQLRVRSEKRTNIVWERLGQGREDSLEVLLHVLGQLDIEESMLDRIEERTATLRDEPLLPPERPDDECEHLAAHHNRFVAPRTPQGCEECLRDGTVWVHLRLCLDCGHVGCCNSSVGKHADGHFRDVRHPVMRSFEPGEAWRWCYVDEQLG